MKRIRYAGAETTLHPEAGELRPGVNEIHDDDVADRLLAAGRLTGAFLPVEDATAKEPTTAAAADQVQPSPAPRRSKAEKRE